MGTPDAVAVGLATMIGAGVFVAFAPAARASGDLLLLALAIAVVVAGLNAHSSARLAARYAESGGAYVYGRERLGTPWGHLAGWAFVVGKTASSAAMALTVGAYLAPGRSTSLAVVVVLAVLALNLLGVQRSARAATVIAAVVIAGLLAFVAVMLLAPPELLVESAPRSDPVGVLGVLQGAGFLFFAFAGYARIATLGEEVRDPARAIPRAVLIALSAVAVIYLLVAVALLRSVGSEWLSARVSPLAEAAEISGVPWLGPVLRVVAGVAATGALLALLLGVSRTVLAMARDRYLPHLLARVDQRGVPVAAELSVALAVVLLVVLFDVRAVIGFSSVCVLAYYAIANASAATLPAGALARSIPVLGMIGCLVVALALPLTSLVSGVLVLLVGAATGWLSHTARTAGGEGG
ncbi:APC family permease [Marihabitans asiaticum]|uniref:APC family permease n=1 Tax=Marihabitans asiaticum TaxID=415218 RepID=UPI0031D0DE58